MDPIVKLGFDQRVHLATDGTEALASRAPRHVKRARKAATESADSITDDKLVDRRALSEGLLDGQRG